MTRIDKIDYSAWANSAVKELAKKADIDKSIGLQGQEIFNFARLAKENNIGKTELNELLGVSISKANAAAPANISRPNNPTFDKAVEYYNTKMTNGDRYAVTSNTYNNLSNNLYKMEKDIDEAFIECSAYKDICIVPRWYYRFYPFIDTQLIDFDLDELRATTKRDMDSLYELRDRIEYIMEEANGDTTHHTPEKTDYDIDKIAQKHLGMSYAQFSSTYSSLLERFKTITYAEIANLSPSEATIYSKAKAYAKEMLETTINEAHTTNWDVGERKVEESLKAAGDMYTISEFEDDGITEAGLNEIQSGIMFKAFSDALISKYQELDPTGIENVEAEGKQQKPIKRVVNGAVLIFKPDGTVYDLQGKQIK